LQDPKTAATTKSTQSRVSELTINANLFRQCGDALTLLIELKTLSFIGITTLLFKMHLSTQFGIIMALLLRLFLGHCLKRLLFALLLASFIFSTFLSNSTTTSMKIVIERSSGSEILIVRTDRVLLVVTDPLERRPN
jgi:hypothetical protein